MVIHVKAKHHMRAINIVPCDVFPKGTFFSSSCFEMWATNATAPRPWCLRTTIAIQKYVPIRDIPNSTSSVRANCEAVAVSDLVVNPQDIFSRAPNASSLGTATTRTAKQVSAAFYTKCIVADIENIIPHKCVTRRIQINAISIRGLKGSIIWIENEIVLKRDVARVLEMHCPKGAVADRNIMDMNILSLNQMHHAWRIH
jgi:hypothetical protein